MGRIYKTVEYVCSALAGREIYLIPPETGTIELFCLVWLKGKDGSK